MDKKYYSVSEYARKRNVTTMTVYNWIKRNKVEYIQVSIGEKEGKKSYVIVTEE